MMADIQVHKGPIRFHSAVTNRWLLDTGFLLLSTQPHRETRKIGGKESRRSVE